MRDPDGGLGPRLRDVNDTHAASEVGAQGLSVQSVPPGYCRVFFALGRGTAADASYRTTSFLSSNAGVITFSKAGLSLMAIANGHGAALNGSQLRADEVHVHVAARTCLCRSIRLQDRNGGCVITEDPGKRDPGRKLLQPQSMARGFGNFPDHRLVTRG
jgi:hypothetical protein